MPIDGQFILGAFLLVVVILVVLFVLVTLFRSIRIIKQGFTGVVERLGRFHKVLQPGLNFLVPFIDRVAYHVDMREQVRSFPPQPVITEDNLVVSIDTVVYFQVTDARAATYEIADYLSGVEQLTTTTLRNVVGGMNLEEALTSRDTINGQLRNVLDQATGKWGLRVGRVELKAIDPPHSIQDSMEKQMRAERDRRAAILTAEGSKQSQILEAEGLRQSEILRAEGQAKAQVLRAKGDAEAQVLLAKGESEAIERVFAAIHEGDADNKLLAYQYLQTLPKLAEGDSNKLWIIPSELTDALQQVGKGFFEGRAEVPAQKAKTKHSGETGQSILDETFQADSVSDVEVPSIAETLQASGIDPKDAGRIDNVSSSTSLADETPDTDYSEAIETAREVRADAPAVDPEDLPDAPQDGGPTRA
ncbi:SPFH domain, Band 7 family protein [Agrococcus baldri]|uniref:SPFH domain, Band 7 family protein n=1 Tax=Agrococcus baldri TaxID=153730 RepID=A0AA94HPE1_9MICO|nr:SPFH domain-containing protein [Agrococcus baldri]SFS18229.1 SPFH domain, Band 7 family protein [Agrococcus baldri]